MSAIPDKIIKLETPKSESDSNYEQFEFMLAWYGRDGSFYQYLFTDWRNKYKVNARALNLTKEEIISNIIQSEEREIRLTAENLTLNDEIVLRSILVSKLIIRLFKDGTWQRL